MTIQYRVLLCRFLPSQPLAAQVDDGGAIGIVGADGRFAALPGPGGAAAHAQLDDEGERCVLVDCMGCLASGVTD